MANFFVRVEIRDGTGGQYATLQAAMAAAGFFRAIGAADGVSYSLPNAEYHISLPDGTATKAVHQRAQRAADSVAASPWVLTMRVVEWELASGQA